MALTLHRVGKNGRVVLGADRTKDVKFYAVSVQSDGALVLRPVTLADSSGNVPDIPDVTEQRSDPALDTTPWDVDDQDD